MRSDLPWWRDWALLVVLALVGWLAVTGLIVWVDAVARVLS